MRKSRHSTKRSKGSKGSRAKKAEFQRRSLAAKRGWATRRKNQRERQAEEWYYFDGEITDYWEIEDPVFDT